MQSDGEKLREFAVRYTAAWCSQDPGLVASFFSPGGSLKINYGAPAVGREAIAESARSFMTMFPDLRVIMDGVQESGDRAEYHWTLTGTYSGPGGNGRRVRISGYEEWKMGRDGLIDVSLGHFDEREYDRQLEGAAS